MSNKREKLKQKIEQLPKNQQIEIFRILEKNNCEYSQNSNAIFFNLSKIEAKTIRKINDSIKYYEKIIDDENKNDNMRKKYEKILESGNDIKEIGDDLEN